MMVEIMNSEDDVLFLNTDSLIELVNEYMEIREATYDFETTEENVEESMMYAFDEHLIHPGEYGDEWEIYL